MKQASGVEAVISIDPSAYCDDGLPIDPAIFDDDVIPVDPSGFDEDAWMAWLEAEYSNVPTAADRVERVVSLRASMANLAAQEARELAALANDIDTRRASASAPDAPDLDYRSLIAELAAAVRVSDRTMASRLNEATILARCFPATLNALEAGVIDRGHACVIAECGAIIEDDEARAGFEEEVLRKATTLTPGRLRRTARFAAERLTNITFEDRHAIAREQRSVAVFEVGDGMSQLVHTLPTALAVAMWDRLTQQAKAIKNVGDSRTFDQIRSDLVTELVLTGQPSGDPDAPHAAGVGVRAEIAIVIPILTLLGKSNELASIVGKGPIDLGTAKQLAGTTNLWTRVLTDPVTDQVLATDDYRPPKKLRRYVRFRDGRCRFPTCNRSAWRCDIDHTQEWHDGGETSHDNLALLCRCHHVLKGNTPWKVVQSSPGILEWTSPLGRVITDVPDRPVRFN
ncbi:MAG: DUF222 domain-containing protein [Terrimesophilobacter sp.]